MKRRSDRRLSESWAKTTASVRVSESNRRKINFMTRSKTHGDQTKTCTLETWDGDALNSLETKQVISLLISWAVLSTVITNEINVISINRKWCDTRPLRSAGWTLPALIKKREKCVYWKYNFTITWKASHTTTNVMTSSLTSCIQPLVGARRSIKKIHWIWIRWTNVEMN